MNPEIELFAPDILLDYKINNIYDFVSSIAFTTIVVIIMLITFIMINIAANPISVSTSFNSITITIYYC
ncbi:MAG: hypothetical protein ACTSQS_16160 [Promethearchaeota archaeon]